LATFEASDSPEGVSRQTNRESREDITSPWRVEMNLLIVCPSGRAALDAIPEHFVFSHGVDVGAAWVGMVEPTSYDSIDALGAAAGIAVLPVVSDPTPLTAAQLAPFAYVTNITASETAFSLRRKLHRQHRFAPFRPDYDGPLGR
jgi:hypothetical protein